MTKGNFQIMNMNKSRHQNTCSSNENREELVLSCDQCDYTSDRRDAMKRHKETVQHVNDNEAENHNNQSIIKISFHFFVFS